LFVDVWVRSGDLADSRGSQVCATSRDAGHRGVTSPGMSDGVSESSRNRVIARLQRGYAKALWRRTPLSGRLDVALMVDTPAALRQAISDVSPPSMLDRLHGWIPRPARLTSSGLLAGLATDRPATLGRSRACDLVLSDDSVSRRHAR
jgi:hypothetical protein